MKAARNATGSDSPVGSASNRGAADEIALHRQPLEAAGVPGGGAFVFSRRRPIPPKLYRIGELVDYSGMSRQTVHNYTTMGLLIQVRWTRGGHRLYDESAFERLDQIAEMRARGKSLEFIRKYFARVDSQRDPAAVSETRR